VKSNRHAVSHESTKQNSGQGVTIVHTSDKHSLAGTVGDSCGANETLFTRFLRWLYPDQRKTIRHGFPPVISFLGSDRLLNAYRVADISSAGFYMLTVERWLPGTEFPVTLKRIDTESEQYCEAITLLSKVVRCGPDGVGFSFLLSVGHEESANDNSQPGLWAGRKDLARFLEGLQLSDSDATGLERAS
jgi:hypothetical protein